MTPKLRAFAIAAGLSALADQATKIWIDATLPEGGSIAVIEGIFYLTHVRNPGASFSLFFIDDPVLRLLFFGGLTLVAIGIIAMFVRRLEPEARALGFALGLILGGAVGNLVDRVARGEVVDFLRVFLSSTYSWPDFNLADSFIVCGVAYLVLDAVRESRRGAPIAE